MLDAPLGDLSVGGGQRLGLHAHHFFLHVLAAAEQIEAGPGEQPGHGIEVGAKGLAADAGGLEGNGTAAAEAVADARRVAEGALAELLDQFGKAGGRGAEMGIDLRPSAAVDGAVDVFRALAVSVDGRFNARNGHSASNALLG